MAAAAQTAVAQAAVAAEAAGALVAAARDGNTAEIARLLEAGADIDAAAEPDTPGPLGVAALHGQTAAVTQLLEAGADWRAADTGGHTAVDWAHQGSAEGCPDAAAVLGAWGAEAELREEMERHQS